MISDDQPAGPAPSNPAEFEPASWGYDRLRRAAFERARERHDLAFFVGLLDHTPAMAKTVDEGGSLGEIGGTIAEMWEAGQQMFGKEGMGELEPMFRAVFEDYLREHGLPKWAGKRLRCPQPGFSSRVKRPPTSRTQYPAEAAREPVPAPPFPSSSGRAQRGPGDPRHGPDRARVEPPIGRVG